MINYLIQVSMRLGISKNAFTENYFIVMKLHDDSLHKFLKNIRKLI